MVGACKSLQWWELGAEGAWRGGSLEQRKLAVGDSQWHQQGSGAQTENGVSWNPQVPQWWPTTIMETSWKSRVHMGLPEHFTFQHITICQSHKHPPSISSYTADH